MKSHTSLYKIDNSYQQHYFARGAILCKEIQYFAKGYNLGFSNFTHFIIYLDLTSLSTLYRSYHDGQFGGQRKPVHTVGQGSVL